MSNFEFIDDTKKVKKAVDHLMTFNRLALDTEGTGLKMIGGFARLLLVQLGTPDFSYLFDARKIDLSLLSPVLESPDILKILHNAKYDYQMIRVGTGMRVQNMFDTMLAYRLITSGLITDAAGNYVSAGFRDKNKKKIPYKSLKFLSEKYLGITLDKSVRGSFVNHPYDQPFSDIQLKYAADDVFVLHPICDILAEELENKGLIPTALLEFQFIEACAEMEINGVHLDVAGWRKIIKDAQKQVDFFKQKIDDQLGEYSEQNTLFGRVLIDINSPTQLLRLFQKRGHVLDDTNSKTLKKLKDPLAKLVLSYREYVKLISTYGENLLAQINSKTKRLHFTLVQLGADTGRLSSEKPNIQNIPNDKEDNGLDIQLSFRDCFQAEEGNVIVTADFSQCELRILAEVSQDPKFLEIFRNDQDLHIITSQQVFGFSDQNLDYYLKLKKEDKPGVDLLEHFSEGMVKGYKLVADARNKTKTINFGIVYGLSAWSLADRFKMPETEAKEILENYFRTYYGIKRWLDKNARETLQNRYACTLLGRKKYFHLPHPDDENFRRSKAVVRRQGNNSVIQGTNADITKLALVKLVDEYKARWGDSGAKALFTVHDEIVSECPEHLAELAAEIKAQVMKDAFHTFIKTVPVGKKDTVDVSVARCWSK